MGKINERTLQMMRHFMELHNAGYTIKEIAKKFELSAHTVYARLQEIADANGVTREELLEHVHTDHVCYVRKFEPVEPVNVGEIQRSFDSIMDEIDSLIDLIDAEIAKQEKHLLELKERLEEWN